MMANPPKWNVQLGTFTGEPQETRGAEIAKAHDLLASILEAHGAAVVLVNIRETPERAEVDVYGWKPWDLSSINITGTIDA